MLTRSSTHFSSSFRSLSSLCIRWYVGSQSPRFQGMNTTNDGGCKWPVCIIQSSDLIVGLHSAFSKYSDAEKQAQIKKVGLGEMLISPPFSLLTRSCLDKWYLRTGGYERRQGKGDMDHWPEEVRICLQGQSPTKGRRRNYPCRWYAGWFSRREGIPLLLFFASQLILDSGRSTVKRHLWLESWKQRVTWCLPLSLTPSWRYLSLKWYCRTLDTDFNHREPRRSCRQRGISVLVIHNLWPPFTLYHSFSLRD